jgi:dCMP deaminase
MDRKWDARFTAVAELVATWSKDPDAKVGAVVVAPNGRQLSTGFNGFPRGVQDSEARLLNKGAKRALTVHAELNALLNCPVQPAGWTMYSTLHPCTACANAIIQSGVGRLVCPAPDPDSGWFDDQRTARSLLNEAGVTLADQDVAAFPVVGRHVMLRGGGAVVVAVNGGGRTAIVKWDNAYDGDVLMEVDVDDLDPYEGPYPNGARLDAERAKAFREAE